MAGVVKFSINYLKKHYALVPVAAMWGGSAVFMGGYLVYIMGWKTDVSWTPWKYTTHAPYKSIETNEIKKIYSRPEYKAMIPTPDAEITGLRKEVDAAYFK